MKFGRSGSHLIFHNTDIAKPEFFSLISKTDTVVTYLPLRFAGRQTMTITRQVEGGSSSTGAGSPVAKIPEGYMISEPGLDTMYRWNRNTGALTPVMAQTPSFASMEYPVGVFYMGESADFIFIETIERKYDFDKGEGFDRMYLLYDKRDGEYYEAIVENDDQTDGRRFFPAASQSGGIPAGQFIYALQPYELLDLHEQGKLRGRLAEIAPTLKEDDNPVMMIVTMK